MFILYKLMNRKNMKEPGLISMAIGPPLSNLGIGWRKKKDMNDGLIIGIQRAF